MKRAHNLRKAFFQVLSPTLLIGFKIQCGLKFLLYQGLSEPEFYGDLEPHLDLYRSLYDFFC